MPCVCHKFHQLEVIALKKETGLSYKVGLLAFEASLTEDAILDWFEGSFARLLWGDPYETHLYMGRVEGVTYTFLMWDGPQSHIIDCERVGRAFSSLSGRAAFLGHNDQVGVDHALGHAPGEPPLILVSEGPYLYGDVSRIEVPYRQKGYSSEMLDALANKFREADRTGDWESITQEESAILEDPDDAIDIISRQYLDVPNPINHLSVTHLREGRSFSNLREVVPIPDSIDRHGRAVLQYFPYDDLVPGFGEDED